MSTTNGDFPNAEPLLWRQIPESEAKKIPIRLASPPFRGAPASEPTRQALNDADWATDKIERLRRRLLQVERERDEAREHLADVRAAHLRRLRRLSAAIGDDDMFSVDATIDHAIKLAAAARLIESENRR